MTTSNDVGQYTRYIEDHLFVQIVLRQALKTLLGFLDRVFLFLKLSPTFLIFRIGGRKNGETFMC